MHPVHLPSHFPWLQGPKDEKARGIISSAVRANFLFRHLDDAGIDAVINQMVPQPVKQGDTVIKQASRKWGVGRRDRNEEVGIWGRI